MLCALFLEDKNENKEATAATAAAVIATSAENKNRIVCG